nr:immunoglobulin light chain junction region [Macaca mulatta]MOW09238.1 immunoglobulin light chain junction region [Macaca mulatta]MOW42557.1 immunoglobulin light chain junction region [Macaca mulatta]
CQQGYNSPLTF